VAPLTGEEEAPRWPNSARWPGSGPTCWPRWRAGQAAGPVSRPAVPDGRGRRRRHTGLDRGGPPPFGERQTPAFLRRPVSLTFA